MIRLPGRNLTCEHPAMAIHPLLDASHLGDALVKPTMAGPPISANRHSQATGAPRMMQAHYPNAVTYPHRPLMNLQAPTFLQKLRIWQQNAHKSKTAQSYILNTENPNNWDIIALQEPWFDSYGNTCGMQYWQVVYLANFFVVGCT